MLVGIVPMPSIKRMEAKHIETFVGKVCFHYLSDITVMPEGHVDVFETAVWLVNSILALVPRNISVWIICEVLRKDDLIRPSAAHWKGISNDAPRGFAIQAQALSKIMDKAHENHPAWMAVASNRLGGLQEMLELCEVCVGIAVVDESVQIFRGFPHALLATC